MQASQKVNTASSASSLILEPQHDITFGKHPLVQRFIKGIFRLRPSLSRYTCRYDATVALRYSRNIAPLQEIFLKDMSLKLAMLLCLLTSYRDQVLPSLGVTSIHLKEEEYVFFIKDTMKTTRPGGHIAPIELKCYPEDESICPIKQITHYLWMTCHIRAVYVK